MKTIETPTSRSRDFLGPHAPFHTNKKNRHNPLRERQSTKLPHILASSSSSFAIISYASAGLEIGIDRNTATQRHTNEVIKSLNQRAAKSRKDTLRGYADGKLIGLLENRESAVVKLPWCCAHNGIGLNTWSLRFAPLRGFVRSCTSRRIERFLIKSMMKGLSL